MRLIYYFIIILLTLSCSGQNLKGKDFNCSIVVDVNYKGSIEIFKKKDCKKIIKKVKHNFEEEDYLYFNILKATDSLYYIEANYSINGLIVKGWVKKKQPVFGIYSKAYSEVLNLHEMPNKSSKTSAIVKYSPKLFKVLDCQENWLLVSILIDNKASKGWMSPDMQCSNQYSTCN